MFICQSFALASDRLCLALRDASDLFFEFFDLFFDGALTDAQLLGGFSGCECWCFLEQAEYFPRTFLRTFYPPGFGNLFRIANSYSSLLNGHGLTPPRRMKDAAMTVSLTPAPLPNGEGKYLYGDLR